MKNIKGYLRPDDKVGIRNKLLILPSVGCSAHVARKVSNEFERAVFINNQYGCGQIGEDLQQTFRTLAGLGKNPNVGGTLIIGNGCEAVSPEELAEEISSTGKPVEFLTIQDCGGTTSTIEKGKETARRLIDKIKELKPKDYPISKILLGLECGASDATSGMASNPALGFASDLMCEYGGKVVLSETVEMIGTEHILSERTKNKEVADKLISSIRWFEEIAKEEGENIRKTQPSPGNKRGGLTTIEEKSLGCIKKAGDNIINDVVDYAESVTEEGLTVMNTPGMELQSMTGKVAGGAQVIVFTTGQGTPCGSPIAPVIKITANKNTYNKMRENMDLYVGELIEENTTLEEEGEKIFNKLISVCRGEKTKSELLGHNEFDIWRIGLSY